MKPLSLFALLALFSSFALSAPLDGREHSFGADRFAGGPAVSIAAPVVGDLFVAGGNIDIDASVRGDAVVAGGNVRVGGPVGQNLYATGGQVNLSGAVQRNARLAGGRIEIGPRARIAGNVSIASGDARIFGAIGGYLQVGAGHVFLDGPVAGDVEIGSGAVELGSNARIGGQLRYASREEIVQDTGAQVRGGIERIELPSAVGEAPVARERAIGGLHWIWSAGMIVLAAVLAAALPACFSGAAAAVRTRFGHSLLAGFIALICIPAAALIAMITVIGIPLALVAFALYFALLLAGYATTGICAGELALQGLEPARASRSGWRALAAALGMLAVSLLAAIPWAGGLVVLFALVLGIGALLVRLKPGATID